MVERLRHETAAGRLDRGRLSLIVAAHSDADEVYRAARRIDESTVLDVAGELSRECEIRATPAILMVDPTTFEVEDYIFGGDEEWIRQRIKSTSSDPHSKTARSLA
jgi:hypothetical protein